MELFTPIRIGRLELKNRLVKSATHESMAGPDGEVTEEAVRFYRRLAKGGVGLIIAGNFFIHWGGHNWPLQLGIHSDDMISGLKLMTDAVHQEGGLVFAQINHCGRESAEAYTRGAHALAPSAVPHSLFFHIPHAMTVEQIKEVIGYYAAAAGRAKQAGFDGVQLHGAHGYLINQFLSPLLNRRKDDYGGDLEKRWRFVQELYHAVRDAVGPDFPLIIKMNATDQFPLPIGIRWKEARRTAVMLAELGLDALEVSCGCYEAGMTLIRGPFPIRFGLQTVRELARLPKPLQWAAAATNPLALRMFPFRENYNLTYARELKPLVDKPVISVGGIRDPHKMERAIAEGHADLLALARPLIAESHFPNRVQQGDHSPSKCVNCNLCLMHIEVKGLRCYHGKQPPRHRYWNKDGTRAETHEGHPC